MLVTHFFTVLTSKFERSQHCLQALRASTGLVGLSGDFDSLYVANVKAGDAWQLS